MHNPIRPFLITSFFCGAMALSFNAQAEQDRQHYGAWNDPNAPQAPSERSQSLKQMTKELKALVKKAEQDRAANPRFIQDLKSLADRYENPWQMNVLSDDFRDGDYIHNPRWSVTSGKYWVEQGYGLRNEITTPSTDKKAQAKPQKLSKEALAFSILGAVLKGNKANLNQPPPAQSVSKPAMILTRVQIPNRFKATWALSSWRAQGRFEIGLVQGTGGSGYRLSYTPGINGGQSQLELLKVSIRGQSVIDVVQIPSLEDKRVHKLTWSRTSGGRMKVLIDEKKMLSSRDKSFQDAFNSLQMISDGTDVIVRSVSILGTR